MSRPNIFIIDGSKKNLDCATLVRIASNYDIRFELGKNSQNILKKQRKIVEAVLGSEASIYSINTGFGFLSDVKISTDKLHELQENLIRSHACGVGSPLEIKLARAIMIAKAHALSIGHSGVRLECIQSILDLLNAGITPFIPEQGSVGASGDLAPLAHMALCLMGEGWAFDNEGNKVEASKLFKKFKLKKLDLAPKEGLALINGTQFMSALGSFACFHATKLLSAADIIGAISLDANRGTLIAFNERVHQVRKQKGQKISASNVRAMFEGSKDQIMESHKDCKKVQDAYSFRCIPQVHGASRDAIEWATQIIENDLNSVSDNPVIFDDGSILSGGNFHGQPLALACDLLSIAVSELGSISERRTEKLTNPNMSGLPAFLVSDSGINSGFMIPHVVAAALVSENKVLAHPASVDSIPTSADKEDHVSMGAYAARKSLQIVANTSKVLGIELIAACQGIDLLAPLKPSKPIAHVHKMVRSVIPFMKKDSFIADGIEKISQFVLMGDLVQQLHSIGVEIK